MPSAAQQRTKTAIDAADRILIAFMDFPRAEAHAVMEQKMF